MLSCLFLAARPVYVGRRTNRSAFGMTKTLVPIRTRIDRAGSPSQFSIRGRAAAEGADTMLDLDVTQGLALDGCEWSLSFLPR